MRADSHAVRHLTNDAHIHPDFFLLPRPRPRAWDELFRGATTMLMDYLFRTPSLSILSDEGEGGDLPH